jgi:hypothetical protein
MLKWISKNRDKNTNFSGSTNTQTINTGVLSGLTSLDIKTHVVNQSIAAWKNGDRIFVWQLSEITDVQKITNRLIILSDDNSPITLYFLNINECELASQKFTDAGNGQVV